MKKRAKIIIVLVTIVIILLGGGLIIWKLTQNKDSSSSLSQEQELEKYLSEKRLDLKKDFVFNLGEEVKVGAIKLEHNGVEKKIVMLSEHLTKLLGEKKDWIAFKEKDKNEKNKDITEEWRKDKLDQKNSKGKDWYIVFDKTKINSSDCNYFRLRGQTVDGKTVYPLGFSLAVLAQPEVQIFKSKKETLQFLKNNDPALSGKS